MANIRERNNKAYEVTVSLGYDSSGKKIRKTKTFKKPDDMTDKKWDKEIQIVAANFEKEVQRGLYVDSDITLRVFVDKWIEEYGENNLEPTTLDSYKRELRTKILPALGHLKLERITPMNILSFLNNLLEDGVRVDEKPGPYSSKTIKYQWQILSSLFQQAVYWQVLPENPCKKVKVPKNKHAEYNYKDTNIKFYNENQTLLLLDIINNEVDEYNTNINKEFSYDTPDNFKYSNPMKYKAAIYIALFCGLRIGEILGLTWNDIDFDEKTLTVNKARAVVEGKGMITKYPKSKSSVRVISVPEVVIHVLDNYKKLQGVEIKELGSLWDKEWKESPWIFTQWDGKGMYYQTISKWLKKAINRHNVSIKNDKQIPDQLKQNYYLPVLSIHKLRHTSATLLISQNTDIRTVSARLGHAHTSTTMNIYVHGLESSDRKASDMLENLLNKDNRKLKAVK